MKRLLFQALFLARWLFVFAAVLLSLVACSDGLVETDPPPEPQSDIVVVNPDEKDKDVEPAGLSDLPEVPRERTLIIMAGEMDQYTRYDNQNPYAPGHNIGFHLGTLPAMYEPLIMFNVLTGEHENWLLEDWAYLNDTEISLTIRTNVTWNDGTPFTVDDIKFTFDMARDNAEKMRHLADLPKYYKESKIVDDRTIIIELKEPAPSFWATTLTSNHGIHILPKHIWEAEDPLAFTNHDINAGLPVGSGPYKMVFASPDEKVYDLRDDWWASATGFKPQPKVERIIYVPQLEESQAAQLLISNKIDLSPIVPVSTIKTMLPENDKITTYTGQDPPYGYMDWCPIDLNVNASQPPYDDKEIRWALSYALDRESLVSQAELGAGVGALHQFTPYGWFKPYEEALEEIFQQYDYDMNSRPEKVAEIMKSKGYALNDDGLWADADDKIFDMVIYSPGWLKAWGTPLEEQYRKAGFNVTIDFSDSLGSLADTGEHPLSLGCKGPSGVLGMDPHFMLSIYTSAYFRETGELPPTGLAISRWQNDAYDSLAAQIASMDVDDPAIMPLFLDAMDIWVSEMPDIYIAQLMIRLPMSTEYWSGWPDQNDPFGFPHFYQWELLKTFIHLEPTQ